MARFRFAALSVASPTVLCTAAADAAPLYLPAERILGEMDTIPYGTVVGFSSFSINNHGDYAVAYGATNDPDVPFRLGLLSSSGWGFEPEELIETSVGPVLPLSLGVTSLNNRGELAIGFRGINTETLEIFRGVHVDGTQFLDMSTAMSSWDFIPDWGPVPMGGLAPQTLDLLDDGRMLISTKSGALPDTPPNINGPNLVSLLTPDPTAPFGYTDVVRAAFAMPVQGTPSADAVVAGFYNSTNLINSSSAGHSMVVAEAQADFDSDGDYELRTTLLVNDLAVIVEDEPTPFNDGTLWRPSGGGSVGDVNASGQWVATTQIYDPSTGGFPTVMVTSDGEVIVDIRTEYEWTGGRRVGPSFAELTDDGDVLWQGGFFADGENRALFLNQQILLETDVTELDGRVITQATFPELSDDGRWAILQLEFDDSGIWEVYRLQIPTPATAVLSLSSIFFVVRHRRPAA